MTFRLLCVLGAFCMLLLLRLGFPTASKTPALPAANSDSVRLVKRSQTPRRIHVRAEPVSSPRLSRTHYVQALAASLLEAVEAETSGQGKGELLDVFMASVSEVELREGLEWLIAREDLVAAEVRQQLASRWAEKDPPTAASWAAQLPAGSARNEIIRQVAVTWAEADLSNALRWVGELPTGPSKDEAMLGAGYQAARTDPTKAVGLGATLAPSPERDRLLVHAAGQWAAKDFQSAAEWARTVPSLDLRQRVLAAVAVAMATKDSAAAAGFVAEELAPGAVQERAAVAVAQRWAQISPQDAAAWVMKIPDTALRDTAWRSLGSISR